MPYKTLEMFQEPSPTQVLWRYLNFPKFIDLIQEKSLFFPSLEQLVHDDPWEGLPSKYNFDPDRLIRVQKTCVATQADGTTDEENIKVQIHQQTARSCFGDILENYMKMQKQSALNLRGTFFVNCWHMNKDESDSQWKIYGDSLYSLAIVTSFERLRDSITDYLDIYGAPVLYYYSDQETAEGNAFFSVIHKRWAFVHEREFRLIHWKPEFIGIRDKPTGIPVIVDLKKLIESIVVSPRAPNWFKSTVEKFIKNSGLSIPVSKSSLLDSFV